MNIDDFEKAISHLDAMGSASREDPAIARTVEKLRKQLLKKGKKEIFDNTMLESLVYLIDICGESQEQAFNTVGQFREASKARAKKLWFETRNHEPEKIE
jgi:hypothetical protein